MLKTYFCIGINTTICHILTKLNKSKCYQKLLGLNLSIFCCMVIFRLKIATFDLLIWLIMILLSSMMSGGLVTLSQQHDNSHTCMAITNFNHLANLLLLIIEVECQT